MTFDDKYFNNYASALLSLDTMKEIEESLPKDSQSGYLEFMNELLAYIEEEISTNIEVRVSINDDADIEYLDSEIEKLEKVKNIVQNKINSIEQIPSSNLNIIFLNSEAGNPFIFRDLKSIPEEYYDSLLELFEGLKHIDFSLGVSDARLKNYSANNDLRNVLEYKIFKLRLFFRMLSDNTILLMQASYKTQTNPKLIKETLESRNTLANKYIDKLKSDLNDPEKSLQLIEENSKIEEEFLQYLKANKRGSK